jgi:succinyl-CoA synthetase beta subunit
MPRKRITEFRAKSILLPLLGQELFSHQIKAPEDISNTQLLQNQNYIIKVDQGIKKRMKLGLVALDKPSFELEKYYQEFAALGYSQAIIEPFFPHSQDQEKYLSLEHTRDGISLTYSDHGGIEVEESAASLKTCKLNTQNPDIKQASNLTNLSSQFLENLITVFNQSHFTFLEINPLVKDGDTHHILDLAVEVDSSAEFFVKGLWSEADFVSGKQKIDQDEVRNIQNLAAKSQASFAFNLLNQDGSIFVLFSGGGASLVLADEIYNLGFGKLLANYGEYSGNPNAQETYIYTKNVVSLLLKSRSQPKVLIIGGGVANFTDIKETFLGIIQALEEFKQELRNQNIKVFVRRGGPNQEAGLKYVLEFLKENDLYGHVSGPDLALTEIIKHAVTSLNKQP